MKRFLPLILAAFLLAACGNDPAQAQADYELAVKYLRGIGVPQNQAQGTTYLQRAAGEGSPDAQLALGFSYLKGRGVEQDSKRAAELFTQAAVQGNVDGQYNIGLAYVRGEGVTKDLAKAAEWFLKSALQDDAGSQYNLGVMYLNGEGVTRDPIQAYVWFKLANDQNYAGALDGMTSAKNSVTKDQLPSLDAEAAKISRRIKKPVVKAQPLTIPMTQPGTDQPL